MPLRRSRRLWLAALLTAAALPATAASAERDLFNEAERRFRGGNYEFALEAYEEFLERFPLSELSADAAYRAGVAQTQLGRYRDAVDTFEQVHCAIAAPGSSRSSTSGQVWRSTSWSATTVRRRV